MIENIYELTWIDRELQTTFRVCPGCHSEMELAAEHPDGTTEWHCPECWQAYDGEGRPTRAISYSGISGLRCPECRDRRIAKDFYSGLYYCKGCKTTFPRLETEAVRDTNGTIVGGKVKEYGEPDYGQHCPNCNDVLRVQTFETPTGEIEAYACQRCDLVYRRVDGYLVPHPECPRCGRLALVKYGDMRECGFCRVRTDLDGQYLNPADAPGKGEDQGKAKEYNTNPAASADTTLG